MGWFLGLPTGHWLPLWFCAALLIYNADRLRRDPADVLNLPLRTAASARLRRASAATVALAALVLIGLPALHREWAVLACILGGSIISLGYSIPLVGFRWKDIPLLKSVFAPAIITAAIFILTYHTRIPPSCWQDFSRVDHLFTTEFKICLFLAPWAFIYLLFNMLLCDLRDRQGDAQCRIRSIPVVLGEKGTRGLLWGLAGAGQFGLPFPIGLDQGRLHAFVLLSLLTGGYQLYLLQATRRPRSERFYEWTVEGLLYLPALAVGLSWLLSRCVLTGG